MSGTPKPTPEAEVPTVKAEPTEGNQPKPEASPKPGEDNLEKVATDRDRQASEVPPSESGAKHKKDDTEEKSAAAAAKERQLQRAEEIRYACI